jgi:hypothetical protein
MNQRYSSCIADNIEQVADALEQRLLARQDAADELRAIALRLPRKVQPSRKPVRLLGPRGRA